MIRWHQLPCALLALAVFGAPEAQPAAQATGDNEALGRAAIVGCSANVKAFSFYRCRYRCTKGHAKSVNDALQGKLLNARFYDNLLIVKGDKDRYEGYAPPLDMKQLRPVPGRKGQFILASPGPSDRYLGDGERELSFDQHLHVINLFSAEKRVRGIPEITPFLDGHRGRWGPDYYLAHKDRFAFSVPGPEEIDGRPVITVRFDDKAVMRFKDKTRAFAHTFSFDPARGYLPIRKAELWNGKPKIQTFVTDIRACSNERWFPERSVILIIPDKADELYDVQEVKLLQLDVDEPPGDDEFVITVPAGTQVKEFDNMRDSFALKQDEKIHMEDIPKLFAMLEKKKDNPLMDTAIPRSSRYGWLRWAGVAAGLALALGGMVFLVRRRRAKPGTL